MSKVRHFTSEFPYCTVLMKRTNVNGYKLRFPRKFCAHIPFNKHGSLIFERKDGKDWSVKYFDEGFEGASNIVVFGGWMVFIKDNYVKIGDTCTFELLPRRSEITLRVTIFRKAVDDSDSDGEVISLPRSHVTANERLEKMTGKSKLFKSGTSSFFRIVLQQTVDRGILLFPKKFAKYHQDDLPNQVSLKVPSGAVWKVEVVRSGDELWLQKGWRAFQKYYAIAHGTFLVFEYKGSSCFDVKIFDRTTTEIDYPCDDDHEDAVDSRKHKEARKRDDNPSVDESLPSPKKRAKSPFPCPQPPKMGRTTSSSEPVTKKGNIGISGKSENPSFAIIMRRTYIYGHYVLIPSSFAMIHLKKEVDRVILQISRSETWTVAYKMFGQRRVTHLKSGWTDFVEANKLQVGDKCIFELINPAECRLKVVIVRAANEKVLMLPAPEEKCLDSKTKTTITLKNSEP